MEARSARLDQSRNDTSPMMPSLLQHLPHATPLLGLSPWVRTDLILAATLLFLVFASWAMLTAAQSSFHRPHSVRLPEHHPSLEPREPAPTSREFGARRGRILGTFGILLGLFGSVGLLLICAW